MLTLHLPPRLEFSTMHRALEIPELLYTIFAFSDSKSNVNNAVVCRQWSEICLDLLWREVADFRRLARLLAPLGGHRSGEYVRMHKSLVFFILVDLRKLRHLPVCRLSEI